MLPAVHTSIPQQLRHCSCLMAEHCTSHCALP